MRIEPKAFGLAAGAVAAILFTLCALAVTLAPRATAAFVSALVHLDLTNIARPLNWATFAGGLVCWSVGTGAAFALAAAFYNRFAAPAR
jgi:hypothetical protein